MVRSSSASRVTFSFALLLAFYVVLLIGGGASRGDALGQAAVRATAIGLMVLAVLFGDLSRLRNARPVLILLGAATMLVLLQIVPLPPTLWQAIPGRGLLAHAALLQGEGQPWRPLSIAPTLTINAASSLIVPAATVVLASGLTDRERYLLPGLILCLVAASTFVGLLQVAGSGFDNPLINDELPIVSGSFANRNHFALFLALGCLVTPVWAFQGGRRLGWRAPVGAVLLLLYLLMILVTGSRAGLILGVGGIVIGLALVRVELQRETDRLFRWNRFSLLFAIGVVLAVVVAISIWAGRAVSVERVFALDPGQDGRLRALPTVLAMVRTYFPWGIGFGCFDTAFRIHEPFALLKPTYFNHVHNDWLEVVLEGGAGAMLLVTGSVLWWAWSSWNAWRGDRSSETNLARLGSAIILLVMIASLFDYPARTPMIMSMVTIAALWLGELGRSRTRRAPLAELRDAGRTGSSHQ